MPEFGKTDLTNCDREPIHIPGSIQPHGCLIVCDANAGFVQRHSANAAAMLGLTSTINGGAINGQKLDQIVGEAATHALRNALATANDASRPALLFDVEMPSGKRFDISIHDHRSNVIVEFEPNAGEGRPLRVTRELIGRISSIDSVERLVSHAARLLQGVLGYDRVMIYRFEQDGAGKVVSEAKRADLESFLGQYFPASDIPQQARELYLRNTIRVISDTNGERVPVEPALDASGEPVDLSFAHLRAVSPIHCEYLRNMGVAASMSISIIIDGALWGLIACHHYSPRALAMSDRVAAEMFGEFFSLHLGALRQKDKLDTANAARRSLDRVLRVASHHGNVSDVLTESLADFASLMRCDGVGVWIEGKWSAHGITAPVETIPALAHFVASVADGRIWATEALSRRFPMSEAYAGEASGVLAIPLSQIPRDYIFFFRRELIQTIEWAGNPEKSYTCGPLGDRLTPRKSFAIWKETVRHQAQPWTEADREIAEAVRAATVEVVLRHNELMTEERAKSAVRQRMLNEELNHRVKNILAVIKSLVGHPVHESRTLKEYVASLKGRIQALAFAHDQVIRGDGGGLLLHLLTAELTPYRGPNTAMSLDGPALWLDSRAFSVMALVLHELATNAAKYGALSRAGGRLDVTWRLNKDGSAEIDWTETGGPPVSPPSRVGFGSALIDRSIPFDLGGTSDVEFRPQGLFTRFRLPPKHVAPAEGEIAAPFAGAPVGGAAGGTRLPEDLLVLLVEDQMLIAMDVEATLTDHGVQRVVTANSLDEALAAIRRETPSVAVLDVNLGSDTSIPVAYELRRLGVPFIFATGYGDGQMIPAELRTTPMARKPYDSESLVALVARVLRDRPGA
jgi:light-regulated signal transduction histidine kinase (bacteriophytochrome)/CheY-like chemotaxis protein